MLKQRQKKQENTYKHQFDRQINWDKCIFSFYSKRAKKEFSAFIFLTKYEPLSPSFFNPQPFLYLHAVGQNCSETKHKNKTTKAATNKHSKRKRKKTPAQLCENARQCLCDGSSIGLFSLSRCPLREFPLLVCARACAFVCVCQSRKVTNRMIFQSL